MRHAKRPQSCPTVAMLLAFLSGAFLASILAERLAAHLVSCPWCREEGGAMQAFLQQDLSEEITEAYRDVMAWQLCRRLTDGRATTAP